MTRRYTVVTGRVPPRPAVWFELREARSGRRLGTFLDVDDARAWIVRRRPAERFRLVVWINGFPEASFRCRPSFARGVAGLEFNAGGSERS